MTEIAAHKFTVSRYVGYGLPDRQVEVRLPLSRHAVRPTDVMGATSLRFSPTKDT